MHTVLEPRTTTLQQLHEDCLGQIFSHLGMREQFALCQLDEHFEHIILRIWRWKYAKSLDLHREPQLKLLQSAELAAVFDIVASFTRALINLDESVCSQLSTFWRTKAFKTIRQVTIRAVGEVYTSGQAQGWQAQMHKTFPNLSSLHLQRVQISWCCLRAFSNLSDLQLVHCRSTHMATDLSALFQNTHLKSFTFIPPVQPEQQQLLHLKAIKHCTSLRVLQLSAAALAAAMPEAAELPNLQQLTVFTDAAHESSVAVAAARQIARTAPIAAIRLKCHCNRRMLRQLQGLRSLREFCWHSHLDVHQEPDGSIHWQAYDAKLTAIMLEFIATCCNLKLLDLRWNCHVTRDFMDQLWKAMRAKHKQLSGVTVLSDQNGNNHEMPGNLQCFGPHRGPPALHDIRARLHAAEICESKLKNRQCLEEEYSDYDIPQKFGPSDQARNWRRLDLNPDRGTQSRLETPTSKAPVNERFQDLTDNRWEKAMDPFTSQHATDRNLQQTTSSNRNQAAPRAPQQSTNCFSPQLTPRNPKPAEYNPPPSHNFANTKKPPERSPQKTKNVSAIYGEVRTSGCAANVKPTHSRHLFIDTQDDKRPWNAGHIVDSRAESRQVCSTTSINVKNTPANKAAKPQKYPLRPTAVGQLQAPQQRSMLNRPLNANTKGRFRRKDLRMEDRHSDSEITSRSESYMNFVKEDSDDLRLLPPLRTPEVDRRFKEEIKKKVKCRPAPVECLGREPTKKHSKPQYNNVGTSPGRVWTNSTQIKIPSKYKDPAEREVEQPPNPCSSQMAPQRSVHRDDSQRYPECPPNPCSSQIAAQRSVHKDDSQRYPECPPGPCSSQMAAQRSVHRDDSQRYPECPPNPCSSQMAAQRSAHMDNSQGYPECPPGPCSSQMAAQRSAHMDDSQRYPECPPNPCSSQIAAQKSVHRDDSQRYPECPPNPCSSQMAAQRSAHMGNSQGYPECPPDPCSSQIAAQRSTHMDNSQGYPECPPGPCSSQIVTQRSAHVDNSQGYPECPPDPCSSQMAAQRSAHMDNSQRYPECPPGPCSSQMTTQRPVSRGYIQRFPEHYEPDSCCECSCLSSLDPPRAQPYSSDEKCAELETQSSNISPPDECQNFARAEEDRVQSQYFYENSCIGVGPATTRTCVAAPSHPADLQQQQQHQLIQQQMNEQLLQQLQHQQQLEQHYQPQHYQFPQQHPIQQQQELQQQQQLQQQLQQMQQQQQLQQQRQQQLQQQHQQQLQQQQQHQQQQHQQQHHQQQHHQQQHHQQQQHQQQHHQQQQHQQQQHQQQHPQEEQETPQQLYEQQRRITLLKNCAEVQFKSGPPLRVSDKAKIRRAIEKCASEIRRTWGSSMIREYAVTTDCPADEQPQQQQQQPQQQQPQQQQQQPQLQCTCADNQLRQGPAPHMTEMPRSPRPYQGSTYEGSRAGANMSPITNRQNVYQECDYSDAELRQGRATSGRSRTQKQQEISDYGYDRHRASSDTRSQRATTPGRHPQHRQQECDYKDDQRDRRRAVHATGMPQCSTPIQKCSPRCHNGWAGVNSGPNANCPSEQHSQVQRQRCECRSAERRQGYPQVASARTPHHSQQVPCDSVPGWNTGTADMGQQNAATLCCPPTIEQQQQQQWQPEYDYLEPEMAQQFRIVNASGYRNGGEPCPITLGSHWGAVAFQRDHSGSSNLKPLSHYDNQYQLRSNSEGRYFRPEDLTRYRLEQARCTQPPCEESFSLRESQLGFSESTSSNDQMVTKRSFTLSEREHFMKDCKEPIEGEVFQNVVMDRYNPGIIQDTVDHKENFNDIIMALVLNEYVEKLQLAPIVEPLSLVEAFKRRLDYEREQLAEEIGRYPDESDGESENEKKNRARRQHLVCHVEDYFMSHYNTQLNAALEDLLTAEVIVDATKTHDSIPIINMSINRTDAILPDGNPVQMFAFSGITHPRK